MPAEIFRCPAPNCVCFYKTFYKLRNHIGRCHGLDPNFSITCGIDGCKNTYTSFLSYKNHTQRSHCQFFQQGKQPSEASGVGQQSDLDLFHQAEMKEPVPIIPSLECEHEKEESNMNYGTVEEEKDPFRKYLLFALKCRTQWKISNSASRDICSTVSSHIQAYGEASMEALLREDIPIENRLTELRKYHEQVMLNFKDIETEQRLWRYCLNKGLVEPVEVLLGHGDCREKETMQYIPMLKVLEAYLSLDDVSEVLLQKASDNKNLTAMSCFQDGCWYQENLFFQQHPNALMIQLYTDEFEVVNPLGGKKGKHKILVFYYSLLNIPQYLRSRLRHIHVAILVRSTYANKYGLDSVVECLKQDLYTLSQQGIMINGSGVQRRWYGALTVVSADNLESHKLAGFTTNFTHGRICRFCGTTRSNVNSVHSEANCRLRTDEAHNYHVQSVSQDPRLQSAYGVTGECPFVNLPAFSVTNCFVPDLMHDILEGSLMLVLKLVLHSLIHAKLFTLQELNRRIAAFSYGKADAVNKVQAIRKGSLHRSGSVSGSASQKWCLFRLLPFFVADMVPDGNEDWEMYLNFREIIDIIFSPVIERSLVSYLHVLIQDFLQAFTDKFPAITITTKMHHLIHYPRLILSFGPLIQYWCMRFEAKHGYFKNLVSRLFNFKNVASSLAKRHQLWQFYSFQGAMFNEGIQHSQGEFKFCDNFPEHVINALRQAHPDIPEKFCSVKSVVVDGFQYAIGQCIFTGWAGELPVLLSIEGIVILQCAYCYGRVLNVTHFNRHFFAYEFSGLGYEFKVNNLNLLSEPNAFDVYDLDSGNFVSMRYNLHEPLLFPPES